MKKEKTKKRKSGFVWFMSVMALSVALLLVCQFVFATNVSADQKFFDNIKINGLDVGGMSVAEAENVVLTDMLNNKKEVELMLVSNDKEWLLNGNDFEVCNNIGNEIFKASKYGRDGNYFQNKQIRKELESNGKEFQISYKNVFSNFEEKIEKIIAEVEQEAIEAKLVFQPNEQETFVVDEGQNEIIVDRQLLFEKIEEALAKGGEAQIEIPIVEIKSTQDIESLKNSVVKRSAFSTNYEKSSPDRKHNVRLALEKFNGLVVESGQKVSFNEITGPRSEKEGYKNANIIVGGVYTSGVGGGVCQVSSTLFNALLLADVDVLQSYHHTLPASYVPLSFDAMVSGDYADLIFQNNLETPIYIKTFADDKQIYVEIYGEKFDDGLEIKTKTQLVKILPHGGDQIVADLKGDYQNKVLYKGEYYRVKYPKEGYESKAIVQYYQNGELKQEKEVRHDFYQPQNGIVVEGVEDVAEGMQVPSSEISIIGPQKVTKEREEALRNKLQQSNLAN